MVMSDEARDKGTAAWEGRKAALFGNPPAHAKPFIAADRAGFIAGWLASHDAAQRPPVSPEVREDLARVVREATAEYFREDLPEDGRDETDTIVDAILAEFSVPPVYDVEKVAEFIHDRLFRLDDWGVANEDERSEMLDHAAALVAVLPELEVIL